MSPYEKILYQMRTQGKNGAERGVRPGVMGANLSCQVGELTLQQEDLLFSEPLLTGYLDAEGTPIIPLEAGDRVLVKQLSGQRYAVIARLVEGDADA